MIQEARVDGRRRRGAMTREIAYQKVLLAVYILSDDEGMNCYADDWAIASACGCPARSVRLALAEMERRDAVWVFDREQGFRRRIIALTDHPEYQAKPGDPVSRTAAELGME